MAESAREWHRVHPFSVDTGKGRLRAAVAVAAAAPEWLERNRDSFLAAAERALLTDRLHPRRRHSLLLGRHAVKRALSGLRPDLDATTVAVRPGVLDQPVVSGGGLQNIQVSLSHSGGVAVAVAFPEACPMGVDIERVDGGNRRALLGQLTAAERDALGEDDRVLTGVWSLKEALSKVLRCGLGVSFPMLEVKAIDAEGWAEYSDFAVYRGLALTGGSLQGALVLPRVARPDLGRAALSAWLAEADGLAEQWSEGEEFRL